MSLIDLGVGIIMWSLLIVVPILSLVWCWWWFDDYFRRKFVGDFTKKSVLVTGTDSGFGRQLSLELGVKGLTVYAGCFTEQGAESLKQEANRKSIDVRVVKLDVSDDDSVQRARETIEKDIPQRGQAGLWGLVNNAGIPGGYMEDWANIEEFKRVMDVNFFGQVRMVSAFLPLIKLSNGRIVNISSILGRLTLLGPYAASKSAVQAYNDGLRRKLAADGIRVSIVEPGYFKTSMSNAETTRNNLQAQWRTLTDQQRQEIGEDFKNKLCDQFVELLDHLPLAKTNRLSEVTESICHALGSIRPKDRYVCGRDARLLYRPIAVMPDCLIDYAMKAIFH